MKTEKLYSELSTFEEFIEYYKGAGRRELQAAKKRLGNTWDITEKKELRAVEALLL